MGKKINNINSEMNIVCVRLCRLAVFPYLPFRFLSSYVGVFRFFLTFKNFRIHTTHGFEFSSFSFTSHFCGFILERFCVSFVLNLLNNWNLRQSSVFLYAFISYIKNFRDFLIFQNEKCTRLISVCFHAVITRNALKV